MYACYIDESGDPGVLLTDRSKNTPVFCLIGLTVDLGRIRDFTLEFLDLKGKFFGQAMSASPYLGRILYEIKGNELRKPFKVAHYERGKIHLHKGFLDAGLALLEKYDCKVFGRIYVKGIGKPVNSVALYTYSIQSICATFDRFLAERGSQGILVCDPRRTSENKGVSHSIFTQKYRTAGDPHRRVIEMPLFGDSQNHAGLQACDLVTSGLIFPLASYTYCTGHVFSKHVDPGYCALKKRYAGRLYNLQYRYTKYSWRHPLGRRAGGLIVSDPLEGRNGGQLFKP